MSKNIKLGGVVPSPKDKRDYKYGRKIKSRRLGLQLPTRYDIRPSLKPVRDQGSQAACSAFAAAAIKQYQEYEELGSKYYFSAQYIYDNRVNYPGEGMYGRDTFKILQKKGCCLEKHHRYGTKLGIVTSTNKKALPYRIKSYYRVETLDEVKDALFRYGAAWVALPVFNSSESFWKPRDDEGKEGGHAVAIVGYDDSKKNLILRNSWGSDWGDNGYTYFPYSDFNIIWEVWVAIDDETTVKPTPGCCLIS